MALEPGTRIGPYRITAPLGAGGMGEVYRAADSKLKRDVAIKVLHQSLTGNADRLARFEREAQLLATLNHPNIAAIYGVEEFEECSCLILELVEGQTLADRLSRGPLPVDEALEVARQAASALEAAHEKGIIHRDLKPANMKLMPDGTVKILDFGLAKAIEDKRTPEQGSDPSVSPTVTKGATVAGAILGTAPYMSPEQARGRPLDKRTDIWSLGCVIFESLTGKRPFEGETTTDVLARIISHQPDLASMPEGTPEPLAVLLRRCLEKDPRKRLRDVGEVRIAAEGLLSGSGRDSSVSSVPSAGRTARVGALFPWAIIMGLVVVLMYGLVSRSSDDTRASGTVSRWTLSLPDGVRLGLPGPGGRFDYSRLVAISPDGSRIAYAVQDEDRQVELHLREIDSFASRKIPNTLNARGPFFSPDGQWLGFLARERIQKVALAGGAPQTVCEIGRVISFDASWSPDGRTIVFATDDGLWRVPASGGKPEKLTTPDTGSGEVGHHSPRVTPDGRSVIFTVSITPETHLALLSLETGSWEIIMRNASHGVMVGRDRLVFARSGDLLATHYDLDRREGTGLVVPVLQGVYTLPGLGGVVLTNYDLSSDGTLVYVPAVVEEQRGQLLWVDRSGSETLITEGHGTWIHPRLSPGGKRISLDIHSANGMRDVYIYEMDRGQMRQLTHTGITWESEWRPDGERIAVLSGDPAGQWSLFWVSTDFGGPPELLLHEDEHVVPADWLPDGRSLLFTKIGKRGIWQLPVDGDRMPREIVNSPSEERHARVSPNGEWFAYTATESGRREVFVQSFPDPGPKYQISVDGGGEPVWSPDGRELFFRQGDRMFAVDMRYAPGFGAGRPRLLFEAKSGMYDSAPLTGHQHYDISPDGKAFLMIRHRDPEGPSEIRVVLNWSREVSELLESR